MRWSEAGDRETMADDIPQTLTFHLPGPPRKRPPRKHTARGEWVELDGVRFYARSQAEKRHAGLLSLLLRAGTIRAWAHEPETFYFPNVKRGAVSYKPDFRVVNGDGSITFCEVKGWWDRTSVQKLRLMARHYPEIVIETYGPRLNPKDQVAIAKSREVGRKAALRAARARPIESR